jgi:RecB family exonuclease
MSDAVLQLEPAADITTARARDIPLSQLLTHSRMACAKLCLRKHYYSYEIGMRPDRDSAPLRFGSAYHNALEIYDLAGHDAAFEAIDANYADRPPYIPDDEWQTEREKVRRLFAAHLWRWENEQYEVIATEQTFEMPLRNPDTGASTSNFTLGGKIDRIIRLADGREAVQEYKTTSEDIADGATYWRRLRLDSQISLYLLAARNLGHASATVIYDVTRKPTIKPKRITKAEQKKIAETGEYFGEPVEDRTVETETPAMYGARLTADIADRPDHYFARHEIPRLDSDLDEFAAELWQIQQTLRECQKNNRWYRNADACIRWGSPCEYFDLCSNGHDPATDGVPAGFVLLSSPHPELE